MFHFEAFLLKITVIFTSSSDFRLQFHPTRGGISSSASPFVSPYGPPFVSPFGHSTHPQILQLDQEGGLEGYLEGWLAEFW